MVQMCISLYSGGNTEVVGTTTSGGTESIAMAIYAHREWARKTKGITNPNLVLSESAHVTFHKACHTFQITPRVVKLNPKTRRANLGDVERKIDKNTIMVTFFYLHFGSVVDCGISC